MTNKLMMRDLPKIDRPRELKRQCAICGKKILMKVFSNDNYTGGNYFGKIPLYTDEEFEKARRAGTTKERWGKTVVEVLKKDPRPYSHAEYWECDECYAEAYEEAKKNELVDGTK